MNYLKHTIFFIFILCSNLHATCDDGIMNGDEKGIDCGGINCRPCLIGNRPLVQKIWSHSRVHVSTEKHSTIGRIEADLEGNRIIWSTSLAGGTIRKIFTAKTDGSEFHEIPIDFSSSGPPFHPPFTDISPDGEKIVFSSGSDKIYLANFDGSNIRVLVDSIINPKNSNDVFEPYLHCAPQFGGSLASPRNVYFIHSDWRLNGTGQAADPAGLYFISTNGSSMPTQIFSARHVADLYNAAPSTYTPKGLGGLKVSDGNLILFATSDYGNPKSCDIWTNLNTSFHLVTENGPASYEMNTGMDISGDGNVVVWKDELNDQYAIKNISKNTLKIVPKIDEFSGFSGAFIYTNYFGNNTLIRASNTVNNIALIDASGAVNFPLFVSPINKDWFSSVSSATISKSARKILFTSFYDNQSMWMTEYGVDGAPSSSHPKMNLFNFEKNWVLENMGSTKFEITFQEGASPVHSANFVVVNDPYFPAYLLANRNSNTNLSNDGVTLGDVAVDNIFTSNGIRELDRSGQIMVPDTFHVRITLYGKEHFTSYDIFPFYILNEPLNTIQAQNSLSKTIELFPNIIHDRAILQIDSDFAQKITLQVFNSLGEMCKDMGNHRIKLGTNRIETFYSTLPPASYNLRILTPNNSEVVKFIKL